jgi:hypothetical protein
MKVPMKAMKVHMKAMKVLMKTMKVPMKAMKVLMKAMKVPMKAMKVPDSKTGIGKELKRPDWMTKEHADEVVTVPVDVRGVDNLTLITNRLEMYNRVCPNMRLKEKRGQTYVLRNPAKQYESFVK